ncbi:Uncharacterized protein ALO48_00176 [Pseudomonas syringae pv. rhaphiolepidis]|nr:Uncharacterized protein ALO48_00176 [Pseudomonas syringae pv. rhaphiolepidis]
MGSGDQFGTEDNFVDTHGDTGKHVNKKYGVASDSATSALPLTVELVDSGVKRSTSMFFQAHITRIISLALIMFGLSGCSLLTFDSVQDPEVHLLKVQVVKARLTQQDFKLYFEVDNPNDSDLFVRGLNYKISLNDVVLADDQFSDWFFVDAHSRKTFVVPVRTNLWRYAKYIAQLLKKPDELIHYRLEGKLKTGMLFRHNVRIGKTGDVAPEELIQRK